MKQSNKPKIIGIIGAIIIVVTLSIFFLLSFEKTALSWWALFFVLLSEIALVSGLTFLGKHEIYSNKVFIHSGISSVLSLYFIGSTIVSLLSGAFKENLNNFIIIQILIIAITAIVTVLIITFSNKINSTEQKNVGASKRGGY